MKQWVRMLGFASLGVAIAFSFSGAGTIDDFSTAYPPNPDLPVSGREVIFVGTTCDGSACPPGLMVSHLVSDAALQTGLPDCIGGERYAIVYYVVGTANSVIIPSYNMLTVNCNAGGTTILDLFYGMNDDLDADLTLHSATAFLVHVLSGDMYSGPRPVPCTITVTSGRGTPSEATASQTVNLVDEIVYSVPFSGFAGVDFTDIDRISYRFDASAHTAVDFGIGPLVTNQQPVAVEQSTWGAVKNLMR